MGFTACTQNEDMAPTLNGQEINATFSVGGMQTRVNTLGNSLFYRLHNLQFFIVSELVSGQAH